MQLQGVHQELLQLPKPLFGKTVSGYVDKRAEILSSIDEWSSAGRIREGKALQRQGHKERDFNRSSAYALWLTGAWLESMERPGIEAMQVHEFLNALADSFLGA